MSIFMEAAQGEAAPSIYANHVEKLSGPLPRWKWYAEFWKRLEDLPVPAGLRPQPREGVQREGVSLFYPCRILFHCHIYVVAQALRSVA